MMYITTISELVHWCVLSGMKGVSKFMLWYTGCKLLSVMWSLLYCGLIQFVLSLGNDIYFKVCQGMVPDGAFQASTN